MKVIICGDFAPRARLAKQIEEKDGTEVLIRTSTGRINKKPTTKTKKTNTDSKQDRSLFDYCDHPF